MRSPSAHGAQAVVPPPGTLGCRSSVPPPGRPSEASSTRRATLRVVPQKPRVVSIGDGNVGTALTQGLARAGYAVEAVGKEPDRVRRLAQDADVLLLAVPFGERENAVRTMGDAVDGKVIVDVTNALGADMSFAASLERSGAEEVQALARSARVVKAFNTVFAQHMSTGTLHGERLAALVAGDHVDARGTALRMARDIGFDAVDAGPLRNARWLEALGYLNVQLGYVQNMGPAIGFRLLHEASAAPERARGAEATRRT